MSKQVKHSAEVDLAKINVHESREVAYWTREFGVSEEKLVAAVMSAGAAVKSVRQHLGK